MDRKYEATWESIDSRPVPAWFDKAKFGIFVHWGIFSVPAFAPKRKDVNSTGLAYSEWYGWQIKQKFPPYYDFHKRVYGENFEYEDFAPQFKAEMFDADKWADLFARAGAKYITFVSKHHDAFTLWPSYYSWNWNSVDIGPHRDILGEILDACEKRGITRGVYYSLLEWTHPVMQRPDPANADISKYAEEKMIPQMKELIEKYRPKILFTDGEWSYHSEKWRSLEFLTWLFNESGVKDEIVINDRWGSDCRNVHGGYLTSEYGEVNSPAMPEGDALDNLSKRKWEENRSIGSSFGFNRNEDAEDYLTEREAIELLVNVVSSGGNLCLNVGPCPDGTISPIIQERLLQLGNWLKVNGEAIYESSKAAVKGLLPYMRATQRAGSVYIMCYKYPKGEFTVDLGRDTDGASVTLLGSGAEVKSAALPGGKIKISAPCLTPDELPCNVAYTFKINF